MSKWAKKVDDVQAEIIDSLEKCGYSVVVLTQGEGLPDLLVGRGNVNWLLECKSKRGSLNKRQVEWHMLWKGQVCVVRSVQQALEAVNCV
jgi:Holliday junction resolvase